jgi:hypothetical protein
MLQGHGGGSSKRPHYIPILMCAVQVGGTCFSPDPETMCGLIGPCASLVAYVSVHTMDDTHLILHINAQASIYTP